MNISVGAPKIQSCLEILFMTEWQDSYLNFHTTVGNFVTKGFIKKLYI